MTRKTSVSAAVAMALAAILLSDPAAAQFQPQGPAQGQPQGQKSPQGQAPAPKAQQPAQPPAQSPQQNEFFMQYLKSQGHKDLLQKVLREAEATRRGTCNAITVKQGGPVDSIGLHVPTPGLPPTAGRWRERWTIDRCGKEVTHNIWFESRPDQSPPMFISLLPGSTRTSGVPVQLQEGFARMAMHKAVVSVPNCKEGVLLNTEMGRELRQSAVKGAPAEQWDETWEVRACSAIKKVRMIFEIVPPKPGATGPDATQARFVAKADTVK
ncbi:MAG: hypothetical protein JNK11_04055 [Alphaproteobacteria bacterium]|nr:hypothetical protein [Alphaproteobacteria bacterium]